MPMKLRVTNTDHEEREPAEYYFEQDRVTIGRGPENDLTLPDPQRIVSSEHAEIRRTGHNYQVVDRGSKNFTYLRNQRLEAGEPYPLAEGDAFQIGEFEIEFVSAESEPSAPAADETAFAADFSNPFADPTQDLLEALDEIIEAYEQEAPQRRDDALKDAIRRSDADVENHEAVSQLLDALDLSPLEAPDSRDGSMAEVPSPPSGSRDADAEEQKELAPEPSSSSRQTGSAPTDEVLDTLLASVSQIVDIPWQFRHQFIGQTIMQPAETKFLYEGDVETMKKHLLDPSISQEERRERLSHVEDAAEALAVHHDALISGYKASVMKGAEELLDRLNPEAHRADVTEENVVYAYVPMLASPMVLDRLRVEWTELKRGDWSAAEQRVFRPAFIKAYLARMTAADSSSGQSSG